MEHYGRIMDKRFKNAHRIKESEAKRIAKLLDEYAHENIPDWSNDNEAVLARRSELGQHTKRQVLPPDFFSQTGSKDKKDETSGEYTMDYDKFM
jgi:hypothetical protein